MQNRFLLYNQLVDKLEKVGFVLIKKQKPHLQNRNEFEFVFEHPELSRIANSIFPKDKAKRYYLKPLSDDVNSEVGLVTGKTSILLNNDFFIKFNYIDTFKQTPAWINAGSDFSLDVLLLQISEFIIKNTRENHNDIQKAYLLTWNPMKWEWKDFDSNYAEFLKSGFFEIRWSCGNSKNIKKGDAIYLLKLGKEPKGIVASGTAISNSFVSTHWNDVNKSTNYINIRIDFLIDFNFNTLFNNFFEVDPDKRQQWFPRKSGVLINPSIKYNLDKQWFDFISTNKYFNSSILFNDIINDVYIEGEVRNVNLTKYERNQYARKVCLDSFGYSCQICNFNFERKYGEAGKNIIHVHHVNPISLIKSKYIINPLKDLVPVCPNCHAMIHSRKPAYSIEEMRVIIKE